MYFVSPNFMSIQTPGLEPAAVEAPGNIPGAWGGGGVADCSPCRHPPFVRQIMIASSRGLLMLVGSYQCQFCCTLFCAIDQAHS